MKSNKNEIYYSDSGIGAQKKNKINNRLQITGNRIQSESGNTTFEKFRIKILVLFQAS